jgi:hypothetical protein
MTDDAINPADLLPGDVLLMLGRSEISKLIAWCDDSLYSHVGLVLDADTLIEAATSGVRLASVRERIAARERFRYIDAYRPRDRGGRELSEHQLAALRRRAAHYEGKPYAKDALLELGVVVAVRGKLPQHPLARWLVRVALDHVVDEQADGVVCSELVYRCFAEADTAPEQRIAPRVVIEAPQPVPFPKVDWIAFLEEVRAIYKPRALRGLAAGALEAGVPDTVEQVPAPSDAALADALAAARAALGVSPAATSEAAFASRPIEVDNPNPRTVMPLDLENSPSLLPCGRLLDG